MTGGGKQEGWKGKGGRQAESKSKCRLSISILMLVTNTSKAICILTQNQSNKNKALLSVKTVGSSLMGLGCVWVGGRDELKDHWATVHWDDQTSLDMAASNALISIDYFTCTLLA